MSEQQTALPVAGNEKQEEKKYVPRVIEKKSGGIYYHMGLIAGKKNVFTTPEYLDMMAGALRYAELSRDIKNLGFVVMPNFFMWIFKLSPKQNDPVTVYGEVKKFAAREILNNLYAEKSGGEFAMSPIFKNNKRVMRSKAEKILFAFAEEARKMKNKGMQKFRIWAPRTETKLISSQNLAETMEKLMKCPVSERWQLVAEAKDYPYLYLAEDWQNFCQKDEDEEVKYIATPINQSFDRKLVSVGS
ncbi:MAG: hypothetical protein WCT18_03290 [Patescibacteria group bacterium]